MRRILLLALKDLRRSIRDRSALAMTIAAPLGLAAILSLVLGDNTNSASFEVTYAVVDLDGGALAESFVDGPLAGMEDAGFATIRRARSAEEGERLARDGTVAATFVVPRGFSAAVQSGRDAELRLFVNPRSDVGAAIARSTAARFAAEIDGTSLAIATAAAAGTPLGVPDPARIRELAPRTAGLPQPVVVTDAVSDSKQFSGNTFMAAGMSVFFLFFTTQFGAVSLLTERREGTLARLLVSPMSRRDVIAGKALYTFALGVASLGVLVVATSLLLGAEWGDPLAVTVLVLAGVFAAGGVQSLVATLARTDEQASGYANLVGVTLGLLGGTFFPLSQAGTFLAELGKITPHFWLLRGFAETSGGHGIATVVPSVLALLAFGLVTGSVALLRSRALVSVR